MKNKIRLEGGKRYLCKEYVVLGERLFEGKVENFARQIRFIDDGKDLFEFVQFKVDGERKRWFTIKDIVVIECLDKDCE